MKFVDLNTETRLRIRQHIENLTGAESAGYYGRAIQLALSNRWPIGKQIAAIESLRLKSTGGCYFPLCSDKPQPHLRHFGPGTAAAPRGDHPSYWLYWNFEPTEELEKFREERSKTPTTY